MKNLTPLQQSDFLMDELCRKRLLVPVRASRSAYVFPHRSLVEYLTAVLLARLVDNRRGKQLGIDSVKMQI